MAFDLLQLFKYKMIIFVGNFYATIYAVVGHVIRIKEVVNLHQQSADCVLFFMRTIIIMKRNDI